ncbi:signal peptidase II [Alteromonas oceanisediminis]|uniref:signal peptidase II n=1 Tax=Alteromonas oceanisediminis TaxID=2836180 RepID=UPI001BDA230D|nr:signal peptidase II [Alteromonas oceanisediminis]MBT0585779.1 signal peptidase II [Alteromonas oceanisediminis]
MLNTFKISGLRFLWLTLIVVILDQWTKYAVVDAMQLYESIQLTGFFNLTYVHNYGAAFSFLHDAGGWQRWFFTVIGAVVSALILYWLRQTSREQVRLPVAFCLILGGAIGNVYDRLAHGYVIDFLDFYYQQWHWPAFNVADSAIFVGAALLIIDMIFAPDEKSASAS